MQSGRSTTELHTQSKLSISFAQIDRKRGEKKKEPLKKSERQELNQRPCDLQSHALPLSYARELSINAVDVQEECRGTPVFGEKRREKEINVRVVGLVV